VVFRVDPFSAPRMTRLKAQSSQFSGGGLQRAKKDRTLRSCLDVAISLATGGDQISNKSVASRLFAWIVAHDRQVCVAIALVRYVIVS